MSVAATFGRPAAIYGPHNTVPCPDCGHPAVVDLGGDHGGQCLDDVRVTVPGSALAIIKRYAERHPHFSVENIRAELDAHGIKQSARGPAFGAAKRKGYIEPDGFAKSTGASAKGAHLQTYTSLIYREAKSA